MGKLRACLASALALAACGDSHKAQPDAPVHIDAPIDTPIDMPVDMGPTADLSCAGMPLPTTADATVTAAGTTEEISLSGPAALGSAQVRAFKVGTVAPLDTIMSDATTGAFTTKALATGGVPLNAYLEGSHADVDNMGNITSYRTTFVFPPQPVSTSLPQVPILIASTQTFTTLSGFANATQDDTVNGALFIAVTDCKNNPVTGATLSVKQGAADVGTIFDLGGLSPMAAGLYFVFNVPDGNTDVNAKLGTTDFLGHTVIAFKKGNAGGVNGSMTTTIVRPGPLP
jgi:hypothetical protein